MLTKFIGGPYDGLEVDHNDIKQYSIFVPRADGNGTTAFRLMPPLENWKQFKLDESLSSLNGKKLFPYQRVFAQNGVEYHFDEKGISFEQSGPLSY